MQIPGSTLLGEGGEGVSNLGKWRRKGVYQCLCQSHLLFKMAKQKYNSVKMR
jgi:peptide methionine sulfoxide reductase MsrB